MAGFSHGTYRQTLSATAGNGGAAAVANPEGRTVYITACLLNVTTKTTAACTLNAGVAANASTGSDNLIDGMDVNAATGVFSNLLNPGSNGKAGQPWGAGQFVTVTEASGAIAGLDGELLIEYITV